MPNPYGQIVRSSGSGGYSVQEFWCLLFEWNEMYWVKNPHWILLDDHCTRIMRAAFPERAWSKTLNHTRVHRAAYNRGLYTGARPKPLAHKYELRGPYIMRMEKSPRHKSPKKLFKPPTTPVQVSDILRGHYEPPSQ